MEYTKNPDPGCYGELLSTNTNYEVLLEITKQLQLEQHVHEWLMLYYCRAIASGLDHFQPLDIFKLF